MEEYIKDFRPKYLRGRIYGTYSTVYQRRQAKISSWKNKIILSVIVTSQLHLYLDELFKSTSTVPIGMDKIIYTNLFRRKDATRHISTEPGPVEVSVDLCLSYILKKVNHFDVFFSLTIDPPGSALLPRSWCPDPHS